MYQILSYIKFLFKSTNQHGVHSPFVYQLVTKCFYDTSYHDAYKSMRSFRTRLLKTNQQLSITDLGAGSKVFKTNKRSVKQIAKTSGTTQKRAKLLFRIVHYFKPKTILELGTSLGIATQAMALAGKDSKIISIEGCPNCSEFAKRQLIDEDCSNVDLRVGDFTECISSLKEPQLDLVFFDGHHNKEATLNYFEQLVLKSHNDSLFIFDDIHWSKDMTEAWQRIKQQPKSNSYY